MVGISSWLAWRRMVGTLAFLLHSRILWKLSWNTSTSLLFAAAVYPNEIIRTKWTFSLEASTPISKQIFSFLRWGHTVLSYTHCWFLYTLQRWMSDHKMISQLAKLKMNSAHPTLSINNKKLQKYFRSTVSLYISSIKFLILNDMIHFCNKLLISW